MEWHTFFTCDPSNGLIYWKKRPEEHFKNKFTADGWNTRYAGMLAGTKRNDGYLAVNIGRRKIKIHRIIWEMVNGPIPERLVIDHINRNRSDNRISNLRAVSQQENVINAEPKINGLFGSEKLGSTGKWISRIRIDGRNKYLGTFNSQVEAHEAYMKAALKR